MQKENLEHLIRAAAEITNRYEMLVIGSQSIIGSTVNPPEECLESMEADIVPWVDDLKLEEELSDLIDGSIGEGSIFHDRYHYYAQGATRSTAILPSGWESRLVKIQNSGTNGRIGYCLDPVDLFLSKCAAGREKDATFNKALLKSGIVKPEAARARLRDMPISDEAKRVISSLISRISNSTPKP